MFFSNQIEREKPYREPFIDVFYKILLYFGQAVRNENILKNRPTRNNNRIWRP